MMKTMKVKPLMPMLAAMLVAFGWLPALSSVTRFFDIGTHPSIFARASRGVAYLPYERLTAVAFRRRGSRGSELVLYDDAATIVERIDLAAVGSPQFGFAFIPPTREFAVSTSLGPRLKILTRAGALVREIDFSPTGLNSILAVAYFNPAHPSGGQFLSLVYRLSAMATGPSSPTSTAIQLTSSTIGTRWGCWK